ncbi:MAG: hypothetical protein AB8B63_06490 [Granulosicoccus sp.]
MTKRPSHRPVGSVSKDKQAFTSRLKELDCDPVEVVAQFCMDNVPCNKCHPGTHKVSQAQFLVWAQCDNPTAFEAAKKLRSKITCPWCAGTGRAILSNLEVLSAAKELLARLHPKLAGKKVEKTVRRVRLSRMNAVSDERREELERIAEEEEDGGSSVH